MTADEVADGFFVPRTKWTVGRINANYDVVNSYDVVGDEVDVLVRTPRLEATAGTPALQDVDADGYASAGDTVTYVVNLKNTGNVRLTGISDAGLIAGELAVGSSADYTVKHTLTAQDLAAGKLAGRSLPFTAANGATAVGASAELGEFKLPAAPEDTATSAPAKAVLSHNNGHDTGLADGDYEVTMNLWSGSNASTFTLYENDVKISTQKLAANTPSAQRATVKVAGKPNGTYRYRGELANAAGTTKTATLVVKVEDANPAKPDLTLEGAKFAKDYTLTTNLWWGTNATGYTLYENGTVIDEQALSAATPSAQKASTSFADKAPGTYRYTAVLGNAAGSTESKTLVVKVK